MAVPAAPAPDSAMRTSDSCLPTTRSALVSAASTTIAVPCWSSWNTGMSSRSRSRASISKHFGAAMSSRLIPPNTGAISSTVRTISSGSWVARQIGQASMLANRLNSAALPSITGSAASGPRLPSPSTAEPSVTTATVLRLIVSRRTSPGRSTIARHTRATPGRVRHRQVVTGLQRDLRLHLDLAAEVEQERAVGHLADGDPLDGGQRAGDLVGVVGVRRRAREVDLEEVAADAVTSNAVTMPAGRLDGAR